MDANELAKVLDWVAKREWSPPSPRGRGFRSSSNNDDLILAAIGSNVVVTFSVVTHSLCAVFLGL